MSETDVNGANNTGDEESGDEESGPMSSANLYGENYYANDLGLPYERSDHWLGFFGGVADRIVAELDPAAVLDVGCAFGFLVEALRDRGVDARGFDFSEHAISQVGGSAIGYCTVRSALEPVEGHYDLITCVEVIEHLEQGDDRVALEHMTRATDRILLSSTPFDHAEPTHLNVQPPEYWAALMAGFGFYRDLEYDASYLTSWAGLFVRREPTMREVVTAYERSEWQFRAENRTLRRELMKIHAMTSSKEVLPEDPSVAETLREQLRAVGQRLDETLARLAEAERDVWVARDAAIGAEAARGAATARLHETTVALHASHVHQQKWQELLDADPRVHGEDPLSLRRELDAAHRELDDIKRSTTWRLGWKLLGPYRRLRR